MDRNYIMQQDQAFGETGRKIFQPSAKVGDATSLGLQRNNKAETGKA